MSWLLAPSAFFYTGQSHGFLFIYCQMLGYPQPLGLRDERKASSPGRPGSKSPGLSCFCPFSHIPIFPSSLLSIMFIMAQLTYAMAEDGLLFRGLAWIPAPTDALTDAPTDARIIVRTVAPTGTPIMAILVPGTLAGEQTKLTLLKSYVLTCIFPVVSHSYPTVLAPSSQRSWRYSSTSLTWWTSCRFSACSLTPW